MQYKVGDIIVSASSDSYVGEIIYISKEEDVVRHRCRKTGTEYEKSYFGFQCRYMTVEERLEKDQEFCTENIQLHQQILTMEREHNDAITTSKERRESIDALTAQLARREREHEALLETAQKALAHVEAERDDFRRRLAGEAAHIKSLEGLLVEATTKADAYERDTLREEVARLNTLLLSVTGENQKRAEREVRALEDWRELRAENDRLKAIRNFDAEYARLDTMWQELVRERDAAVVKAAAHERDWYEAKSEFGTAAAKLRDQVRTLEAALTTETRVALDYQNQRDEARRDLGEILAVIHRDGGHYTGEHGISKSVADAHATWAVMVRERDEARAEVERLQERVATQEDGLRHGEQVCARLVAERDEARAEVERLRGIIQEWSYPRLYVQPGVERETLLAQLQENLVNKVRPSIEAVEEQERERCARICDLEFAANWHASAMAAANAAKRCAELIRKEEKP